VRDLLRDMRTSTAQTDHARCRRGEDRIAFRAEEALAFELRAHHERPQKWKGAPTISNRVTGRGSSLLAVQLSPAALLRLSTIAP